MTETAKLLSLPTNFAVVQLPERRYPGVVVQGDTLTNLVSQLTRMKALLKTGDLNELAGEIDDVKETLVDALSHYKSICAKHSIGLPFTAADDLK